MLSLGRKAQSPTEDVQVLRDFVQQLLDIPLLFGQAVKGVILNGDQSVVIRHSLGRQYTGGLVTGVSDAEAITVQTPEGANALGVDITKYVRVQAAPFVSQDTTVNVWVF